MPITLTYCGRQALNNIEQRIVEKLNEKGIQKETTALEHSLAYKTLWVTESERNTLREYGIVPKK